MAQKARAEKEALKTKIEKSVGYPLSSMRVVEYVMFLNGRKDLVNSIKKQ